jgi:SAM-dependent methyltransferase
MASPNAEQIDYWAGRAGERWVQQQETMDRAIGPLGLAALDAAAVRPGEVVVDVGCGCGDTSLELARRVGPAGRVLGVDVSRPMLERARARGAGVGNLSFVEADAASAALPPATDLVFSRFGVMFFADPLAALTHLHGQLAPRGRLAFVTWRPLADNEWARLPLEATDPQLPPAPPADPHSPGPFAFADGARLERILEASGFRDVTLRREDRTLCWLESPSVDDAVSLFSQIGTAARRFADATTEERGRALAALRDALAPRVTRAGLLLGASVWVVTARAGAR